MGGKSKVLGFLIALVLMAVLLGGWHLLQPKSQEGSQTTSGNEKVNTPPIVTLLYPVGGEKLSGVINIRWSASDPDNDVLSVTLQYTTDPTPYCPTCPPQRWHIISTSEDNDGTFEWDTTKYPNGQKYQLKVVISDGKDTVQALSGTFSVIN
ncbi:MAG: Ig-like domain-containing protein [Candidatus Bathyarchaeia archaeon]